MSSSNDNAILASAVLEALQRKGEISQYIHSSSSASASAAVDDAGKSPRVIVPTNTLPSSRPSLSTCTSSSVSSASNSNSNSNSHRSAIPARRPFKPPRRVESNSNSTDRDQNKGQRSDGSIFSKENLPVDPRMTSPSVSGWQSVIRDAAARRPSSSLPSSLSAYRATPANDKEEEEANNYMNQLNSTHHLKKPLVVSQSSHLNSTNQPAAPSGPLRLSPCDDTSPVQSQHIAINSEPASPMVAFPSLQQSPPTQPPTSAAVPQSHSPPSSNEKCITLPMELQQHQDEPCYERSFEEVMELLVGDHRIPPVEEKEMRITNSVQEMKSIADKPHVTVDFQLPNQDLATPIHSSGQAARVLSPCNDHSSIPSSSVCVDAVSKPSPWNPPLLSPNVTISASKQPVTTQHASSSISNLQQTPLPYAVSMLRTKQDAVIDEKTLWFADEVKKPNRRQKVCEDKIPQCITQQTQQAPKPTSRDSFSKFNEQVAFKQSVAAYASAKAALAIPHPHAQQPEAANSSRPLAPIGHSEARHREAMQGGGAVIHHYPITKFEFHVDDNEDEEDMPIAQLSRTASNSVAASPALMMQQVSKPKQHSSFKPPRTVTVTTDGSAAVARTSNNLITNTNTSINSSDFSTSSSSSSSSIECPLRFYPPSYIQQFGKSIPSYHIIVKPANIPIGQTDGSTIMSDSVFPSPYEYSTLLTQAVCMSMQPLVNKIAKKHEQAVSAFRVSGRPASEKQNDMRRAGVSFYNNYTLSLTTFDQQQFSKAEQRREAAQQDKAKRAQLKKQQQKQMRNKRKAQMAGKAYVDLEEEESDDMLDANEDVDMMDSAPLPCGSSAGRRYYLKLEDIRFKERAAAQGDVWIISNNEEFDLSGNSHRVKPGSVRNFFPLSNSNNFVLFVCSLWHSFSKNAKLEIKPMPLPATNNNSKVFNAQISKSQKIFALRLGDFRSECSMLQVLNDVTQIKSAPLLPYLLHGVHWKQFAGNYDEVTGVWLTDAGKLEQERKKLMRAKQITLDEPYRANAIARVNNSKHTFVPLANSKVHSIAALHVSQQIVESVKQEFIARYVLNKEQLGVLDNVLGWFHTINEDGQVIPPTSCPIQLVHGCFGAGKSYLLVVIIGMLAKLLKEVDPNGTVKILIASLTNVAVDGILLGLQKLDVDFIRIGSVGRVSPPIVRHMVHVGVGPNGKTSEEQSIKSAEKDLRDRIHHMRAEAANPDGTVPNATDVKTLELALEELGNQKKNQRKKRLQNARIVGMTCAACEFEVIQTSGVVFPIVFLDEASQMTEPTSLIPIIKFKAERLLAVGDPLQLPPTLPGLPIDSASSNERINWLARTLFVRLKQAGIPTMPLLEQFRMHPTLSQLPNQLFYDNTLRDGVSAEKRFPLLVPTAGAATVFPPLMFLNVGDGVEERPNMYGYVSKDDSGANASISNSREVHAVAELIRSLLGHGIAPHQIGVITPYRAQVAQMERAVHAITIIPKQLQPSEVTSQNAKSKYNDDPSADSQHVSGSGVLVATVDSFQGAERDIIVLTTVRTTSTDFIDNPNRLNVSITRARHHLILVGKELNLKNAPPYQRMIQFSRKIPGSYKPNIQVALQQMNMLEINPQLLKVQTASSEDGGDVGPSSLSCRQAASDFQSNPKSASAKSSKHSSSREPQIHAEEDMQVNDAEEEEEAEDDEDEHEDGDDFLDEIERQEAEEAAEQQHDVHLLDDQTKPRKRKRISVEEEDGMSPYSRQQLLEKGELDGEEDSDSEQSSPPITANVNINDVLQRDAQRRKQRKLQSEANIPSTHVNDDEGEAQMEDQVMLDDMKPLQMEEMKAVSTSSEPINKFTPGDFIDAPVSLNSNSFSSSASLWDFEENGNFQSTDSSTESIGLERGRRQDVDVRTKRRRAVDAEEQ